MAFSDYSYVSLPEGKPIDIVMMVIKPIPQNKALGDGQKTISHWWHVSPETCEPQRDPQWDPQWDPQQHYHEKAHLKPTETHE